jgi:hypothetical protein
VEKGAPPCGWVGLVAALVSNNGWFCLSRIGKRKVPGGVANIASSGPALQYYVSDSVLSTWIGSLISTKRALSLSPSDSCRPELIQCASHSTATKAGNPRGSGDDSSHVSKPTDRGIIYCGKLSQGRR